MGTALAGAPYPASCTTQRRQRSAPLPPEEPCLWHAGMIGPDRACGWAWRRGRPTVLRQAGGARHTAPALAASMPPPPPARLAMDASARGLQRCAVYSSGSAAGAGGGEAGSTKGGARSGSGERRPSASGRSRAPPGAAGQQCGKRCGRWAGLGASRQPLLFRDLQSGVRRAGLHQQAACRRPASCGSRAAGPAAHAAPPSITPAGRPCARRPPKPKPSHRTSSSPPASAPTSLGPQNPRRRQPARQPTCSSGLPASAACSAARRA